MKCFQKKVHSCSKVSAPCKRYWWGVLLASRAFSSSHMCANSDGTGNGTGKAPACHPLAEWQQLVAADQSGTCSSNEAGQEVLLACADAGSAPAHPAWCLCV